MANLPIPDEQTWILYEAYSGVGPLTFPFSIFEKANLVVEVDGVAVPQNEFTFTGTLIDSGYRGGSVSLNNVVSAADVLIYRDVVAARTTDFAPSTSVPLTTVDAALDQLTALAQDARRDIGRAILAPVGESALRLSPAADRADRLLGFDADGALAYYAVGSGGGGGGIGDVVGPGSNTDGYVPIWNGANSKTLANGRAIGAASSTSLLDRAAGDVRYARNGGTYTAVLNTVAGTLDLSAYSGQTVLLTSDGINDNNIWKVTLSAGQRVTLISDAKYAFLFDTGYTGANVVGQFAAVANHRDNNRFGTLPFGTTDVVYLVGQSDGNVRVWLDSNNFVNRIAWQNPGSSREPLETFYSIGTPGVWSDTKGLPYGDFLAYVNGTVGKPITSGMILRGHGDTAALFLETYDIDSDGYIVPWTNVGKIGNHVTFRTGWDDGSDIPSFTYTMPTGYGGPGSLGQGFHSQIDFYASALPSGTSTPGGMTLRATRIGTPTPIDVLGVHQSGAVLFYGKAALEGGSLGSASAAAALAALGAGLTLSNIPQWHSPALDIDRNSNNWYGTAQFISTPVESSVCQNFADISMRHYGAHDIGYDIGLRADEGIHWHFSVSAGSIRTRSFGLAHDLPGLWLGGAGATGYARYQSWEVTIANNAVATFALPRSNRRGHVEVVGLFGHSVKVGFDQINNQCRLMYSTTGTWVVATTALTGTTGTVGNVTVSVVGNVIYVENRSGASSLFVCEVKD